MTGGPSVVGCWAWTEKENETNVKRKSSNDLNKDDSILDINISQYGERLADIDGADGTKQRTIPKSATMHVPPCL